MRLVYEHNLGAEVAYERIGEIIQRLDSLYGGITSYSYWWSDDHRDMEYSIRAMGASTRGRVSLDDKNMTVEGSLPFVVKMMFSEEKLEQLVREQLDLLFSGKDPGVEVEDFF